MLKYVLKRTLQMVPTLIVISILSFIIIQLPPGDYLTVLRSQLQQSGDLIDESELASLEARYGLDQPVYVQYWRWVSGFVRGDFGFSFAWQRPVSALIWDRLALTFWITLLTTVFVWIVGFAIGLYSATHQYSIGDYTATTLGFIGLATPNFMLALVLMWIGFSVFGMSVGGLFSAEYAEAPWSLAKVWDLLKHLWIPVVVIGTAGTAGLIRIFRANLLDEMQRPYMDTARAKGVPEKRLVMKYPVRVALIPFVATVGWTLPTLVSGATITSIVLNIPMAGPLLLSSLLNQDMYLAATFIMFLSALTVIGTLISDILLAVVDPRIRLD